MVNSGLGTFIFLIILVGAMLVDAYRKGKVYFDTKHWEFKMKKDDKENIKQKMAEIKIDDCDPDGYRFRKEEDNIELPF